MIVDIYSIKYNIINIFFVKYIVIYKKTDKHTKVRRKKIMIEKQKKYQNVYYYRQWKKIWKDQKKNYKTKN